MSKPPDVAAATGALSQVEKLSAQHNVKQFRSGKHQLDHFLKKYALKNQNLDSSQTYVVHRDGNVVAYYSLTVGSASAESCPPTVIADMPPDYPIPVVILARLAVDEREHGRGLGKAILKDALHRITLAADIVGARAVLVYAIDNRAKDFYEHFDFEEFPGGSLHLMLSLKDIRLALGKA